MYQYHEEADGRISEEWTLGRYNATATAELLIKLDPKLNKTAAATGASAKTAAGKTSGGSSSSSGDKRATERRLSESGAAEAAAGGTEEDREQFVRGIMDDLVDIIKSVGGADADTEGEAGIEDEEGGAGNTNQGEKAEKQFMPLIEPLDYLPDTPSMARQAFPYMVQMYTGGDMCSQEGYKKARTTQVRLVCSPDQNAHMLVREPEFCSYIVVLYLPVLCNEKLMAPKQRESRLEVLTGRRKGVVGSKGLAEGLMAAAKKEVLKVLQEGGDKVSVRVESDGDKKKVVLIMGGKMGKGGKGDTAEAGEKAKGAAGSAKAAAAAAGGGGVEGSKKPPAAAGAAAGAAVKDVKGAADGVKQVASGADAGVGAGVGAEAPDVRVSPPAPAIAVPKGTTSTAAGGAAGVKQQDQATAAAAAGGVAGKKEEVAVAGAADAVGKGGVGGSAAGTKRGKEGEDGQQEQQQQQPGVDKSAKHDEL